MQYVFAVVLILFYIFFIIGCFCSPHFVDDGDKKSYDKIHKKYGDATFALRSCNGFSIWENKGPFSQIMVMDKPTRQKSVHATINYYIDPDDIHKILSISDSIRYDKLKYELTANCDIIELCVATLVIADMVSKKIIDDSAITENYRKEIINACRNFDTNIHQLEIIKDSYDLRSTAPL
jgi:hypothetical protein